MDDPTKQRVIDAGRAVADAFAHHRAGRRVEAEALCRAVLEREPRNAGALHVLAAMAHAQGRLGPALKLAQMAVPAAPAVADDRNTLGIVLADLCARVGELGGVGEHPFSH